MDGRFYRICHSIYDGYCVRVNIRNVKISVGRIKNNTKRVKIISEANVVCYCVCNAVDPVHGIRIGNSNVHSPIKRIIRNALRVS